jgi:uncharacterized repeat protein (TIGR01451 family)
MKKLIAYAIVMLFLLQLVQAGEVFNDEVKDNVPFFINDIKHIARYYPSAEKVSILAGEDRVLVVKEDCNSLNDYTYCLDSVEEGINEETSDPASVMQLRVLQKGPTIGISRSISNNDPMINEVVEVTATVTNSGNERASNINYEDKYPTGVKISSAYYSMVTNSVAWTGSLNAGDSQDIKYTLRFQDFLTYDSTAQAKYIFNNKVNTIKSSTVTFDVQKPYAVSDSISTRSADINEEIMYSISINNTGAEDISISSLKISIPAGAVVSHRDTGLDLKDNKVSYTGTIPAGDSKELSFRFKSSKVLQGELVADVDIRVGTKTFNEKMTYKIGIGVSAIVPDIKIEPSPVKGGAELEIEAKITNEAEEAVSGISLDMSGDLVEPRGWRDLELDPGKKHYAFNKIINAPSADEERKYYLKLSGSYETASGKTMKFEEMKEVTVQAQEKVVEMTPEIIVKGKDVNVTLKVKNVAPYKLTYVSLIDTFPQGFRTIAGSRDIDIDELAIGQEITAYSYVVQVPDTYTAKSFDITHIFNGLDKSEEKILNEKRSPVVLGGTGKEAAEEEAGTVNETAEPGTDEGEAGAADAEGEGTAEGSNPGVFSRIWNWIKGLFSGKEEETFE